ncbi:hypothetical protein [Larkinella punicea]|uniref:Uncharacterized protein n=1 Tax=Larkinella punicea TaxID=2315727 RepID=A0A368JYG5_9BACT|nr:hypothetical protein [Larkinella punicea]RCR71271.1 hypothetical protein DUE52_03220 [Larkinella punicea]
MESNNNNIILDQLISIFTNVNQVIKGQDVRAYDIVEIKGKIIDEYRGILFNIFCHSIICSSENGNYIQEENLFIKEIEKNESNFEFARFVQYVNRLIRYQKSLFRPLHSLIGTEIAKLGNYLRRTHDPNAGFDPDSQITHSSHYHSTLKYLNEHYLEVVLDNIQIAEQMISGLPQSQFPSQIFTVAKPKKVKRPIKYDFRDFILEENSKRKEKLISGLTEELQGAKPQEITYMLYALYDLGFFNKIDMQKNQTKLYEALKNTFGFGGTRQGLNNSITVVDRATSSIELEINRFKKLINSILTK